MTNPAKELQVKIFVVLAAEQEGKKRCEIINEEGRKRNGKCAALQLYVSQSLPCLPLSGVSLAPPFSVFCFSIILANQLADSESWLFGSTNEINAP